MRRLALGVLGCALSLAMLGSCSNDPTLAGSSSTGANLRFQQIDRLGKGTNAFFAPYAQHDTNDRDNPTDDPGRLSPEVTAFFSQFGRSAATASAAAGTSSNPPTVLIPDVLIANLTAAGDASFLGVETNGTLNVSCTSRSGSGLFGGRALTDDAGRGLLAVAFGNALSVPGSATGGGALAPDDGKELDGRNGTPNVANDNVGCAGKGFTLTEFPYVGAPH